MNCMHKLTIHTPTTTGPFPGKPTSPHCTHKLDQPRTPATAPVRALWPLRGVESRNGGGAPWELHHTHQVQHPWEVQHTRGWGYASEGVGLLRGWGLHYSKNSILFTLSFIERRPLLGCQIRNTQKLVLYPFWILENRLKARPKRICNCDDHYQKKHWDLGYSNTYYPVVLYRYPWVARLAAGQDWWGVANY